MERKEAESLRGMKAKKQKNEDKRHAWSFHPTFAKNAWQG
jgi:hypothetical protein